MIYKKKDGLHLVTALYSGIVGRSERQATATYLVDTLSREELIQFIERMLLGIEMIKNRERKRPCDKEENNGVQGNYGNTFIRDRFPKRRKER